MATLNCGYKSKVFEWRKKSCWFSKVTNSRFYSKFVTSLVLRGWLDFQYQGDFPLVESAN